MSITGGRMTQRSKMLTQQDLTDAFILFLSGAAEMENDKEIKWEAEDGWPVTIEFINNSPTQAIVRDSGDKYWYLNGKLHREDGPAIEWADGTKSWYLNDQLHREDGPAYEYANGNKFWCLNGQLHREDGPAIEYIDGDKYWYINNQLHREDGPATEWADGTKHWYLNDQELAEEEFNIRKPK